MSRTHVTDDLGFDPADPDSRARLRKEKAIRWVDVFAYAVIIVAGILVFFQPPQTVQMALNGSLTVAWAILLIICGLSGLIGRLSRLWVVEAPGALAGSFGAALYVILLVSAGANGRLTTLAVSGFVACMSLLLIRRYIELQLFTTDPGDVSWTARLLHAVRRRTKDAITSGLK